MITIRCDFRHLQKVKPSEHVGVASQVQDYIPLRQRLRRALDQEQEYTVHVYSRILARWLKDLRDYGPSIVRWEEVNLREQFRERFGFLPPSELDQAAIHELELLSLPVPDHSAANDPTGWILAACLDPLWGRTEPDEAHLAHLAAWAATSEQPKVVIAPLMHARLAEWVVYDKRYQIFSEYTWREAGTRILLRWALRSYPLDFELRRELDSIPLVACHNQLDACREVLQRHESQLQHFWGTWLATQADKIAVIKQMSGLSNAELGALETWIRANPTELDQTLLALIATRFPDAISTLKQLERLISPPPPTMPDQTWSTEEWLSWATAEYMPYFAWIIGNKRARETQMKLANRFADWLIEAYPTLSFDKDAPSVIFQQNEIQNALTRRDVVLWLVVDGLTWWQAARLSELCAERALAIKQMRPTLSALPSVTSISKRALAQGYLDSAKTSQSMAQLFKSQLGKRTAHVSVYTQHPELESAFKTEVRTGIYLLLYNALDAHNHACTAFTDDERVDGHLSLLARLTDEFFQASRRQGLSPVAFVGSDHGSTLLPSGAPVLKVPRFAYELDKEENQESESRPAQLGIRKSRAYAITSPLSEEQTSRLEADWYLLPGAIYNLPSDLLIPKGYAAVKRRPRGWTHGGATPEETVVAFIELQPEAKETVERSIERQPQAKERLERSVEWQPEAKERVERSIEWQPEAKERVERSVEWQPEPLIEPIVKIEGFLTPRQTTCLRVLLTNPNSVPLNAVRFDVPEIQATLTCPSISANSQFTHEVVAASAARKGQVQILAWDLSCEGGGRRWDFSGQVEVPIRRFQVSAVDELFGDML
ncbi:MAG: hypothetical protein ACPGWR_03040 [Ardenticatenaceae bacterium]